MSVMRLLTAAILAVVLFCVLFFLVVGSLCAVTLAAAIMGQWVWTVAAVCAATVLVVMILARLGGGQKAE